MIYVYRQEKNHPVLFTNLAIQSKGSPSHIGISGIQYSLVEGKI